MKEQNPPQFAHTLLEQWQLNAFSLRAFASCPAANYSAHVRVRPTPITLCTGFLIVFFCSFFCDEVKVFTYSFIFLNYVFVGVLTVAVPRNLKIENKRAVRKRETC